MGNEKDISQVKRCELAQFIALSAKDGMLPRRKVEAAMARFGVSRSTVFNFWRRVKNQVRLGLTVALPTRRGGKRVHNKIEVDFAKLKAIPFHKRGTLRNLANGMSVSKNTIHRWKSSDVIRPHTNAINPTLTELNKITRLKFSLLALRYDSITSEPTFRSMTHTIHADEKWFNMTECTERYYICNHEDEPYRSCQSKKFVTKVMFFCAVSRPMYKENGELLFDDKIEMWPFTKREAAKRKSRNMPAGTMITKALDSINRQVTKEMVLNHVLPAIKEKWPFTESKNIVIQWDNAPPHVSLHSDPEFIAATTEGGFNITLQFQPPNSPDTNVNDLGWFRSIQSLKTDVQARTIDELVNAVQLSYNQLSHITLDNVFLTLQSCLNAIMIKRGSNDYKIVHMGKEALRRRGLLTAHYAVTMQLVKESVEYLMETGNADGLEGMMKDFF